MEQDRQMRMTEKLTDIGNGDRNKLALLSARNCISRHKIDD